MEFSAKVGHETRNKLEHFRGVAVNPMNTGSIFLFSGFVIVGKTDERIFMNFS